MSMAGFLSNNKAYEVQANNQVASLLAEFDSGYIMGVIEDTLNQVFTHFDIIARPNIVQSFETNFKEMYNIYESDLDNINQCRIETYQTIIDIICKKFELYFRQPENADLYSLAYFLYDFFVSRMNIYMVEFYVKHILAEKENIIHFLNMEELMKSKDPNFIYNQRIYRNDTLATIATNLPLVLRTLASNTQVTDHQIYMYTYGQQPNIVQMIEDSVSSTIPIFSRYNSILFNDSLYGPIITYIRIKMQQTMGDTTNISNIQ
jgi:hypothetical protein